MCFCLKKNNLVDTFSSGVDTNAQKVSNVNKEPDYIWKWDERATVRFCLKIGFTDVNAVCVVEKEPVKLVRMYSFRVELKWHFQSI